jgi:hypothetical protein
LRATYYISFDGVNYSQFYPSNEPKVKLTQEPGEIFKRWRVDSFKIGATKNASIYFDLLHYFFASNHYTTDIGYQIKENGITTFEFIGPVLLGKINTETSVYECAPDPDDAYRDIMLQYETKWQDRAAGYLFGHGSSFYVGINPDPNIFSNLNPGHPGDFTGWSDVTGAVGWANNGEGICKARNTLIMGQEAIIKITAFSGDSIILRSVDAGGTPIANVTINAVGDYPIDCGGATYMEAYNNSGTLKTGSFTYKIFELGGADDETGGNYVQHLLDAVLNGASYMNLSIATIYSTILWDNALDSDAPENISYIPGKDYVTGVNAIWKYLWLMRTDGFTTWKDNLVETSLKDVMDILKYKLRLFWFIDSDGYFRIEHEKYFRSFDPQLTVSTFAADKPEIDNKVYNYSVADVYKQTNYSESNQSNEDWIPYPHIFTQNVNKAIQDIGVSNLTTDIKFIVDNPTTASGSGYALLRMVTGLSQPAVSIDASDITATNFYLNTLLGWHYILKSYHSYFASANVGTVNNAAYTFDHVKEYLTQEGIKFHPTAVIDWRRPITTENGIGWITSAEYSPETGMITINVGYNPYA